MNASPSARAERFLASTLPYARDTFDAILLWDVLDYLDREAAARVVSQLTKMMRSGGVMLAVFHMRLPEQLHRYRVLDGQNLELVPAPPIAQAYRFTKIGKFRTCSRLEFVEILRRSRPASRGRVH